MTLHYFTLARTGRRVLFRESEYTTIRKADFGEGLVLFARSGAEFRVTTSQPQLVAEERELG